MDHDRDTQSRPDLSHESDPTHRGSSREQTDGEDEIVTNENTAGENDCEKIQEVITDTEAENDSGSPQHQENKISKIKKRVAWLEDRIRESFVFGCQRSFTPGATDFAHEPSCDGKIRKLLCNNSFGRVTLLINPEDLEPLRSSIENLGDVKSEVTHAYELRNLWMNIHAKSVIEVECFEAGEGKRTQNFSNMRGFHLASISCEGFALGRSGMYSNSSKDSNWLPSLVEYRPFTTRLSTIQKASWCNCLSAGEVLVALTVGSSSVVFCSDAPRPIIRVLSLNGMLLYTSALSCGIPIALAASRHLFVLIEQIPSCSLPWDFRETCVYNNELFPNTKSLDFNIHFDRYERLAPTRYRASVYIVSRFPLCENQGSWVHLAHRADLTLYENDELVFLAFTQDNDVPIIATKNGSIYALMASCTCPGWVPSDLSQFSELAQLSSPPSCEDEARLRIEEIKAQSAACFAFEWVPISDPLNRITKQKVYYLSADSDAVKVVLYEIFLPIPVLGEVFSNVKTIKFRTPLCLPLTMMSQEDLPVDIERWCKTFQGDVSTLPWPFLDEYRHRKLRQELCQDIWKASLQVIDTDLARLKQTKKLVEILTLKECVKILHENLNDALSEASKHLAYSSSLNFLSKSAARKGERLLTEEISNIKQTKDLLKELRHELLIDENSSQMAATSEQSLPAPPLARASSPLVGDTGAKVSPLDCGASEPKLTTHTLENLIQKCVTKKRRMNNP